MALVLKSQRQIQTDILNAIISRLGLTDVNPGSVLDLLTQSVSQEDFNQYVQMSQIVRLVDLDATTGTDLENRAFEYGLTRAAAVQATGVVNILRQVDGANYTKVTTSFVSAGVLAPSRGDTVLRVNTVTGFAAGGVNMVVIGRGLSNEEVKLITAIDTSNNTITINSASPLAFDHSFTEEVTFIPAGQLDITISSGTTVSVPATGTNAQIDFATSEDQTIFAGEASVININVRALLAGAGGNVGTGTISVIDQDGIGVTNTTAFTTGQDLETDESLRDRIRSHIQSLSRGTQQAVLNAIVGLVDAATSKRVVSANVVLPQSTSESVRVFIDDGTGFEPSFSPQASETLVEDSSRGTQRLQLDFAPIVKASIESANAEPFNLSALVAAPTTTGLQLTVRIGGVGGAEETISVLTSDIEFASTVTAEEIVRVINNKATIFEARTSNIGTRIVVNAVADINEDIFVDRPATVPEVEDLNTYIQLTNAEQSSLYLYKNDALLNKDGLTAAIQTPSAAGSTFNVVAGSTLVFEVDGKTSNRQTITFSTDDAGTRTPSQVAIIINREATGIVASAVENNGRLQVASATLRSSSSSIRLFTTGGTSTANDVFQFPTTIVTGANSDYTLNRELGTVELATALVDGDTITAGNAFSRATIRTPLAVSSATRINEGVGFNLVFDNNGSGGVVNRDIIFADDRFAAAYLDDITRTDNTEFGFNKVTQLGNLPQYIADYVTKQIYPFGKAVLRVIGNSTFIEIRTNTFASDDVQSSEASNNTNGTLQLARINDSGGVQRQLGIWEGVPETLLSNQIPHSAFRENSVTRTFPTIPGPAVAPAGFDFSPTDTLVTVMNNDQTNGTFVLPAGNLDVVAGQIANNPDNFTGTNLSSVYGTTLDDTDRDYTSTTNPNPFASANPWTNIPADASLLDFYVAFTGRSAEVASGVASTTVTLPNDNNSLAISPTGDFRVPTVVAISQSISVVATNTLTVVSTTGILAGDVITVNQGSTSTLRGEFTVASVTNATTLVLSNATGIVVLDTIVLSRRTVARAASPVLSVSVTNGVSTYTIGTANAPTTGNSQLQSSDFAASRLQVGDIIEFSGMGNSVNDGTFVITALSSTGVPTVQVTNASGAAESSAAGTAILGQRRRITGYNFLNGQVTSIATLGGFGFRDVPLIGIANDNPADPTNTTQKLAGAQFYVIANTIPNIQLQLANSRLSSISSQAEIVASDRGQRVQISSLMEGSAGFVEVTGGNINTTLLFSTIANRGLQGYNYYTGLLALVHRTIYGDDTDLITFPGIGAAGVNFQVLAPTVTSIILELDVTLQQGVSIAAVENEVNTAITGYINGLGVGADIIVEELRARTIRINGITDVSITRLVGGDTTTTTIANIAIADNEIARIAVSNITIG